MQEAVARRQNFRMPEQGKLNRFMRYPPRKVPPPPAGTVTNPATEKNGHFLTHF